MSSIKYNIKIGDVFGLLTVIDLKRIKISQSTKIKCICDCGNIKYVSISGLKLGGTRSCGCLKRKLNTKHGETKTRLHNIWSKIKYRCNNSNYYAYSYYGGKGVKVCKEWTDSFESFRNWSISNGYTDELTIDRIDSNGNYEPSNCRWVTSSYNSKRTGLLMIKVNGIEDSLKGWNKRLGVGPHMLPNRYKEYGEEYIRKAIELFLTTGDNSHLYMRKGYSKAMVI